MLVRLFDVSGDLLEEREFSGSPQVNDVMIVEDRLMSVDSRRWSQSGVLEITLDLVD